VTFNIVNLTKPESLFNQGMRPVIYSYRDAETMNLGWCRAATDIQYRINQYTRQATADGTQPGGQGGATPGVLATYPYYTLSFTIDFPNPDDVYLIAHTYPYTFSDHKAHLSRLTAPTAPSRRFIRHSVLCSTLGGNDCDLLTITDFGDGDEGATTDGPKEDTTRDVTASCI
jgi:cytosolic carboxypeptidase protein 2/3